MRLEVPWQSVAGSGRPPMVREGIIATAFSLTTRSLGNGNFEEHVVAHGVLRVYRRSIRVLGMQI